MEKFCLFEIHEYMDMYPSNEVRTFKGADEDEITLHALYWADHMTRNYSGGTTRFVKVMTKVEAADFMVNEFKKCLMTAQLPDDMNIRAALKVTSENNIKLFFDCYGRNASKK